MPYTALPKEFRILRTDNRDGWIQELNLTRRPWSRGWTAKCEGFQPTLGSRCSCNAPTGLGQAGGGQKADFYCVADALCAGQAPGVM